MTFISLLRTRMQTLMRDDAWEPSLLKLWRVRLFAYGALVLFAAAGAVWGTTLPLNGNIHDVFIWINAGYFIESGLQPHVDFSSPLGPLYLYAVYAAWLSSKAAIDIPFILGFGTWLLFSAAVIIFRRHCRPQLIPDILIFLFVVSISGRQLGDVKMYITWYGNYNRFCWVALLLLVLVLIGKNQRLLTPTPSDRIWIGALTGLFLAFTLLIKLNFFVAIGALYFGWMLASGAIRDWRSWVIPAAIVIVAAAAAQLAGIDLRAYAMDIAQAGEARRSSAATRLVRWEDFLLGGLFVAGNMLVDLLLNRNDGLFARRQVLACAIALALILGITGDFGKPIEFFLVLLGWRVADLYPQLKPKILADPRAYLPLSGVAVLGLVAFTMIEAYAVTLVGAYRLVGYPASRSEAVAWRQDGGAGKTVDIRFSRNTEAVGYRGFAEIIDQSPNRDRVLAALSEARERFFVFDNASYVRMIDEGLQVLKSLGRPTDRYILPLEFTNPYPMLLNRPPLKKTLLWLHDGTTFNGDNLDLLDTAFDQADVVLMPHVTEDADMRPILNDMFKGYNARRKAFCQFHMGRYWAFYRRC